jgi:hypothetical protein
MALAVVVLSTVAPAVAWPQLPPPPPPRQKLGEELLEMYLAPRHVRFEIDYDQQHHPGSGTTMQAWGVFRIDYSDGTHDLDLRHISGLVVWHSSDENVYPILVGELGNLNADGLFITWQYNDGITGTTIITISHPECESATGTITAYDGRK